MPNNTMTTEQELMAAHVRAGKTINQAWLLARTGQKPDAKPKDDPRVAKLVEEINAQSGKNPIAKVNAFCVAKLPGHSALDQAEQIRRAGAYLKDIQAGTFPEAFAAVGNEVPDTVDEMVKVVNSMPGRNHVERANAFLCSRVASHKSLDLATQCRVAGEFVQTLMRGEKPVIR